MTRIAITTGASGGSSRRAATHYGPREIEDVLPGRYAGSQGRQVFDYTFSFDDLPVPGLDEAILRLPANSRIIKATLRVLIAFAGGTSYNIGVTQPDGTAIDADGIDAAIALTAIDAVGETVLCNGALVNNLDGIGTAAGQVDIVATGTFTAGKAVLSVEFEELLDRA